MEFKLNLKNCRISGNELILCDKQIVAIHNFFERQCMLEYVGNNNCNWPDEKIEFVAGRAYEILQEDVDDENEHYAIESALEEWEESMLRKYEMELDELKHPLMVEESSYECPDERLNSPEKIVKLLNECFRLDKKAEEYVYMLAFDAKCNPLGVFELGHGSVNACILNPREIFQRALICGAVNIVIAHNHPSHDTTPSKDDDVAASKISEAGRLMKIQLVDFINN